MDNETIVIGLGPAGIGATLGLQNECLVLERSKEIGGGSATIERDGATFDIGGHSFHTPHPEVRDLVFNSLEMFEQKREARCFSGNDLINYPFQKNFRELSDQNVIEECVKGLDQVETGDFPDYNEFIHKKFGPGIAKHFMLPYNQKLWGRDLRRLTANWTGERVAAPEGVKEKFDTSGGKRKPLQADTNVAYPAKGGFGEIFKTLAKQVKNIEYDRTVGRIELKDKRLFTKDGKSYPYRRLVSSMPVNELLALVDNCPADVLTAASKLDYLSLKVVMVVIDHPIDTPVQRIYAADPNIAAHKTAMNHNSSDYLRKQPRHGIMAEVSYSPQKPLKRADLEKWVVENLLQMKMIRSESEVLNAFSIDVKYAYPVPTHDRSEIVKNIKSFLEENEIYSVGRFGEWAYINSDEVLARGLTLGKRLLHS